MFGVDCEYESAVSRETQFLSSHTQYIHKRTARAPPDETHLLPGDGYTFSIPSKHSYDSESRLGDFKQTC